MCYKTSCYFTVEIQIGKHDSTEALCGTSYSHARQWPKTTVATFPNDEELKLLHCIIYQEIHCANMFMNVVTKPGCYAGFVWWIGFMAQNF